TYRVFGQDRDTDQDQHDAAGGFGIAAEFFAQKTPRQHADGHQDKGGGADGQRIDDDIGADQGQGDAHGQRIDAGADGGQHQNRQAVALGLFFVGLATQRIPDHLAADKRENAKGDPVIVGGDEAAGRFSESPAN